MNSAPPKDPVDLFIVGAGPAGMAAAVEADRLGLSVIVADENASPGGQVYRSVSQSPISDRAILGGDYHAGRRWTDALQASGATLLSGAAVWSIERRARGEDFSVAASRADRDGGRATSLFATRSVLIATGALERPFPIPGLTLPGVMTAGAAQILLKASALVPEGPTVLAGCGPLLYLLAAQYARAGAPIAALLDATPRGAWKRAAPHLADFLSSSYAWKGLKLLAETRRATRVVSGVAAIAARGDDALREVVFTAKGRERRLEARTLLLHQGVVPQVNLAMAAGCDHVWNEERLAFEPVLDAWGASSVDGLYIAGDSGGIDGANAAAASGGIAALAVAARLGGLDDAARDARAAPLRKTLARARRGRRFLDALYRPAENFRKPADEVVVCRCEETTAGAVRAAAAHGAPGPNQVKTFLRAGMGPCQGRLCGLTVSEIMAESSGRRVAEIGHYRIRNPVKPITLGELAALQPSRAEGEQESERLF